MQVFNHITPPLSLADKTKENLFGRLLNFNVISPLSSLGYPLYLNPDSSEMFDIMKSKDIRFIYNGISINLGSTFHMQGAPETKLNIFSYTPTINDMNSYLCRLEVSPSSQILQQIPLLYEWVTNKFADPKLVKFVVKSIRLLSYINDFLSSFRNLTHVAHDIPKPSFDRTFVS